MVRSGASVRAVDAIVGLLLILKLAITAWNSATFDGTVYDQGELHAPRARSGGLSLDGRAYNPPLYYMATLPFVAASDADPAAEGPEARAKARRAHDRELLGVLRWSNLAHLAIFYGCWLGLVFPRALPDPTARLLASVLLLALPGYQKLAAMVHPDNALASVTALGFAFLFRGRDPIVASDARARTRAALVLATLGGLAALARPFGAMVAVAFALAAVFLLARPERSDARLARAWLPAAGCVAIAGVLTAAWPVYQLIERGRLSPVYSQKYLAPYLEHRDGFDRLGYFASFHPFDLIRVPNRKVADLDRDHDEFHNRYGNSFWTLSYSELWGDHWLYFSGKYQKDDKIWPKRILLALALPSIPLFAWRFFRGVAQVSRDLRNAVANADLRAFALVFLGSGLALFLYWQLGDGLTPGKNSAVKFIYNAYLVPIAILIAFATRLRVLEAWSWLVYAFLLFTMAIPVAMFWPSW